MARHDRSRLTRREGRSFGLTVGIAFLVLGAVATWRARPTTAFTLGGAGAILVLAGALIPTHLGPVLRGWMGLAHAISKITTPIFMSIIYFGVLTPVGLLRRTFGGRPLQRERSAQGYWIDRGKTPPGSMERQF